MADISSRRGEAGSRGRCETEHRRYVSRLIAIERRAPVNLSVAGGGGVVEMAYVILAKPIKYRKACEWRNSSIISNIEVYILLHRTIIISTLWA